MVIGNWHSHPSGPVSQFTKPWEELFDDFFYRWPKETKPPIEAHSVYSEDQTELIGIRIQMALAGFTKEDVSVWFDEEEGKLHIKGSNKEKEEILERFKCDFNHTLVYASSLDIAKAEVKLEDGMLDLFVPLTEKKNKKVFLFGK